MTRTSRRAAISTRGRPPLRPCAGGCGTRRRAWSLHFLCPACRAELPAVCSNCVEPLEGRPVCRQCGHRHVLSHRLSRA